MHVEKEVYAIQQIHPLYVFFWNLCSLDSSTIVCNLYFQNVSFCMLNFMDLLKQVAHRVASFGSYDQKTSRKK